MSPQTSHAADATAPSLYIEPGVTTLRAPDGSSQLMGKVVVNLQTGEIWGFPTLNRLPYPVDTAKSDPPTSSPMYLGRYNFGALTRE